MATRARLPGDVWSRPPPLGRLKIVVFLSHLDDNVMKNCLLPLITFLLHIPAFSLSLSVECVLKMYELDIGITVSVVLCILTSYGFL